MASTAGAEPLLEPPALGRVRWGGGPLDPALVGFVVEARILGVLGGSRFATWPDRQLGLEPGAPALAAGRAGLVTHFRCAPLVLVLRADLAELARPWVDGPAAATAGAIVDDAYLLVSDSLLVGRGHVPWGARRADDEMAPFVVDRIAPDRRSGVTYLLDHGALAGAAGVYEDLDDLEPRARVGDPSSGGQLLAAAQLEGSLAPLTASSGLLYRRRDDGSQRLDAALSLAARWRWFGALAEGILSRDHGETQLGGHGALTVEPIAKLVLVGRAEWDRGAGREGEWALAGGFTWHVTPDRRSKVAFLAWARRDVERGTAYDGVVVMLQASQ